MQLSLTCFCSLWWLVALLGIDNVLGSVSSSEFTKMLYRTGRYPRSLHKTLLERRPYQHVVLFKHHSRHGNHLDKKTTIRKRTLKITRTSGGDDPLDVNRRKHVITGPFAAAVRVTNTRKNGAVKSHHKEKPGKSTVLVNKKNYVRKITKDLNLHRPSLDPMDQNRKKYVVQPQDITGSRKDDIINGRYYYQTIGSDVYPFDGNKRNSLSVKEKDQKITAETKTKPYLQDKIIRGANEKEVVFSTGDNDDSKPVEFYLAENNGQLNLAHGRSADKLLEENRLTQPVDGFSATRQEKDREKERNEYINQVLDGQSENEEKGQVPIAGVPYPDGNFDQNFHNTMTAVPFQLSISENHHQPTVVHEQEQLAEHVHKFPEQQQQLQQQQQEISYPENNQKFDDKPPEEATYGDHWNNQQENARADEQNDQSLSEKIKNFNKLMNKLHRTVVASQQVKPGPEQSMRVPTEQEAPHVAENMNWQHQPYNEEYPAYPSDQQRFDEMEMQRPDDMQGPENHENGMGRFQTAFKLTKAIMNGAKNVDEPGHPDIKINGQTLIPEVFEAFSKTNNDLKQRYDMLQRWALTRSTTASEKELRQQIRNLNELSDMVRLVNNLEKDMLKTILKRRRGMGVTTSYKHEIIPDSKDQSVHHRFHSPSDVHDLLQYIYDTYIENRTVDDIPVVLQAFQKSVTDIVTKKNISAYNNFTNDRNVSIDSALIGQSIENLNKQVKDEKNNGLAAYTLDDDALTNFDFDDHSGKQGFFKDFDIKSAYKDHALKDEDDHKLNKFVDKKKDSPIITVKLLKALDLFLDSIEIGRKIKRFRSKVEEVAHSMNGSVLMTSSMRHSLGELNKEINETLHKSNGFKSYESKNGTSRLVHDAIENKTQNFIAQGFHGSNSAPVHQLPENRSPESYQERLEQLKKALNGDVAEDYNNKPYDDNGIYYEKHKEDPNYLSYEKQWYENATINGGDGKQEPIHYFNPNMNVENFTASVNNTAMVYVDPHSLYAHIPDLNHEMLEHDITDGSFNEKNITKLNKEALKGLEAINKAIPFEKLLKTENNTSLHDLSPENITQLNNEAAKGSKYYHDQLLNHTDSFDKEVQKIIDSAINEAKNGSSVSYYYQGEKDGSDHFDDSKISNSKLETPRYEMNTMYKALDNGNRNVNMALNKHKIDAETANATIDYLSQEDKYINNMFFEENNETSPALRNNKNNFRIKSYAKFENSDKKDHTPNNTVNGSSKVDNPSLHNSNKESNSRLHDPNKESNSSLHDPNKESKEIGQQKMHQQDNDDFDASQIEHLRKLVKHLQDQSPGEAFSTSNISPDLVGDTPKVATLKNVESTSATQSKEQHTVDDMKKLEKEFFVAKNSSENKEPTLQGKNEQEKHTSTKENFHKNPITENKGSLLWHISDEPRISNETEPVSDFGIRRNTLNKKLDSDDERFKSEENDYLIREQESKETKFNKRTNNGSKNSEGDTGQVVKAIDSATNFKELEKAISEIKSEKKTLELVHQVASGPELEQVKEGDFDKRNMKGLDMDKAQKLMEEINSISYIDDDDDAMQGTHRSQVPQNKNNKRSKIYVGSRHFIKKKRKPIQKRHVTVYKKQPQRLKASPFGEKRRYHKRKRHGRWKAKSSIKGTKKNLIEGKDADLLLKESFIDKLSASQQKLIWHILKRAYHNAENATTNATVINKTSTEEKKLFIAEDEKSQQTLDSLLKSFLEEKPTNTEDYSFISNLGTGKKSGVGNNTSDVSANTQTVNGSVDPYATINLALKPELPQDLTVHPNNSTDVFPTDKGDFNLSNQQKVAIRPSNTSYMQDNRISSTDGAPQNKKNESLQTSNEDMTNGNRFSENENNESYEDGNNEEYFFKDGVKRGKNIKASTKSPIRMLGNSTTEVTNKELPSIMKHLDKVSKFVDNETATLLNQFKNTSTNFTNDEGEGSGTMVSCKNQSSVTTDGDDIFNLPVEKCMERVADYTNHQAQAKSKFEKKDDGNCKQHYLTIKDNGFTYKIPAIKCNKNDGIDSAGLLHVSDLMFANTSKTGEEEEEEEKGKEKNSTQALEQDSSDCEPLYKTLMDGETAYKIKVGCKQKIEKASATTKPKSENNENIKDKNGTVEVIRIAKPDRNERVIYKGKNMMMTQDDLGSEKIIINGSNKMIEIGYPPEDDQNGFITLKQGNRLYKIPYKNHTLESNDNLLAKSELSWTPDYVRAPMSNTETFKVRNTAITKDTYKNGAKVITMEKEKASLSIYYPPKNKTRKYHDTGYMILKENGKTYNIPLDGNKTLKVIGNKTYLGSDAFKNINKVEESITPSATSDTNATTDNILNRIQQIVPQVDNESNAKDDIMHIKERRFRNDDFQYQPKAYKIDKFRHQKHLIEAGPKSNEYVNEDSMEPVDEEHEEERSKFEGNDEEESELGDGRLHRDPNHVEVFPTIPFRGVDLSEFAGSERKQSEDGDEKDDEHNRGIEEDTEAHRFGAATVEDTEQERNHENEQQENEENHFEPVNEDEMPAPEDQEEDHRESEEDRPNEENRSSEEEEDRKSETDEDEQNFFPLQEKFTGANDDSKTMKPPRIPSLIFSPQLVPGGVGLQNLHPFSNYKLPPSSHGSVSVTGLQNGKEENVQITPITGSMNPDINDRNRLEDFTTYAMGRTIKGGRKRKKGKENTKKMKQFVNDIVDPSQPKALMSSAPLMSSASLNQLAFLRKVQGSTLKQIGYEFNRLQNEAIHNYMHPANDKLDKSDKETLQKLGYTNLEFDKFNKQIVGKKRSAKSLTNVGIDVNGKRLGNLNLLPRNIPSFQG